jgi:hypothetical protein
VYSAQEDINVISQDCRLACHVVLCMACMIEQASGRMPLLLPHPTSSTGY